MNQQNLKSKSCLELDFLAKFEFSVGLVWFGMVFWYISYVNSTFYIHKVWYWKGHFVGTVSLVWYGLVWIHENMQRKVYFVGVGGTRGFGRANVFRFSSTFRPYPVSKSVCLSVSHTFVEYDLLYTVNKL